MKQTLLVDMDGVLADFVGGVLGRLPKYSYSPSYAVPNTYEFLRRDFPPSLIDAIIKHPAFFRLLDPLPGAVEGFMALAEAHDLWIVSTPVKDSPASYMGKAQWVAYHLGSQWADRLILTHDKTLIRGDILIDDKPRVVGHYTPTWTQWLFDQPYNRESRYANRVTWDSIVLWAGRGVGVRNEP